MLHEPPLGVPSWISRLPGTVLEPLPELAVQEGRSGRPARPSSGQRSAPADRSLPTRYPRRSPKSARVVEDRAAPVEAPRDGLRGSGRKRAERAVVARQGLLRRDVGRVDREPPQPAEGELGQIDPDSRSSPLVRHRTVPVIPGQDEDDRPVRAAAPCRRRHDAEFGSGTSLKPPSASSARKSPSTTSSAVLRVAEVVEVADFGAPGRRRRARRAAGHAAGHGAGVDHEVVVLAEEQIGRQDLEPAQDARALDVALQHGKVGLAAITPGRFRSLMRGAPGIIASRPGMVRHVRPFLDHASRNGR